MASFEFIDAAAKGYKFFWQERKILFRLGAFPFLLKLASFVLVASAGLERNYLRQGLIFLPSYFAEGWLIAQAVRMAICNERWPVALHGDPKRDAALIALRARSVSAATLVYVLIKLALAFFSGIVLAGNMAQPPFTLHEPALFALSLTALAFTIWGFRFLWLYVPAALNYSVADFLKRIAGYRASFEMIGIWLLCMVPVALALVTGAQLFAALFPSHSAEPSAAANYAIVVAQAATETIAALISSLGIAYKVQAVYEGRRGPDETF